MPGPRRVLTIGHSTHSFGAFLALLQRHEARELADVRSIPFSRMNPQFNREALEQNLVAQGIRYVFCGYELGARPSDPSCCVDGRVRYELLERSAAFREGIDRLGRRAERNRLALMCSEKEPLVCHRAILVARAFVAGGFEVAHILASGRLESHNATLSRLMRHLRLAPLEQPELFRSRSQRVAEAYQLQAERIAFEKASRGGELLEG